MTVNSPRLKDLALVMVKPGETMRRILDSGPHRWGAEIAVLACISSSIGDFDVRGLKGVLPDLDLTSTMSLVVLGMVLGAIIWVIFLFLASGLAMLIGRTLGGTGSYADVRTALGWSLVPIIWALVFRVPLAIYLHRLPINSVNPHTLFFEFITSGGLALTIVLIAIKIVVEVWIFVIATFGLAEALQFSWGKGVATVLIAIAIPIVLAAAFVLTMR